MKDRDNDSTFDKMFGYHVGPRGVEPKLKLKIEAMPGLSQKQLSLADIVDRIILGPSLSAPLQRATILRMLKTLSFSDLSSRVISSTIPFRAT
jgi:hypothetical protein